VIYLNNIFPVLRDREIFDGITWTILKDRLSVGDNARKTTLFKGLGTGRADRGLSNPQPEKTGRSVICPRTGGTEPLP